VLLLNECLLLFISLWRSPEILGYTLVRFVVNFRFHIRLRARNCKVFKKILCHGVNWTVLEEQNVSTWTGMDDRVKWCVSAVATFHRTVLLPERQKQSSSYYFSFLTCFPYVKKYRLMLSCPYICPRLIITDQTDRFSRNFVPLKAAEFLCVLISYHQ